MELTDRDRSLLAGDLGSGPQMAMGLVLDMARTQGATELIDIRSAHIDGCLYHGRAGLDFARFLADGGARVAVPTTLNVASIDLLHPDLYKGDPHDALESREQMDAYVAMGCEPTWTCGPYQLDDHRPALGDQIAWGESNAVVFANSVIGARTERYGDFFDICCAVTGRAPFVGLHREENRRATTVFELDLSEAMLSEETLYPVLGGLVGDRVGTEVPCIVGLPETTSEDQLKALGAASASTGAVAMFHAPGITAEAGSLEEALQGESPVETVGVRDSDLREAVRFFHRDASALGAISIGTPHFSVAEFRQLDDLIGDRRSTVPFFINTSRDVLDLVRPAGIVERLEAFGATVVTDTCVYVTPIITDVDGVVMTNSGKAAFYAPGNLGVGIAFGSLGDCVESAVTGDVVRTGPLV